MVCPLVPSAWCLVLGAWCLVPWCLRAADVADLPFQLFGRDGKKAEVLAWYAA